MMINDLLDDKIDIKKAEEIQIKYARIVKEKEKDLGVLSLNDLNEIRRIAGVDVSYYQRGTLEFGVSCAVLWDLKKRKIIDKKFVNGRVNFPYKAGFLGFREAKLLIDVISKLRNDSKKLDVVMCDGHGIIHPRRFGEAVHIGLTTGLPSFGVAKNPYIGYSDLEALGNNKGDKVPVLVKKPDPLQDSTAEVLGYAIRLNNNTKSVYISKGFRMNIDLAIKIALETTLNHRLPEPLYLADKLSREKVKKVESD